MNEETSAIQSNLVFLQADLSQTQNDAENSAHYGTPHPMTKLQTGHVGWPKFIINPEWLTWAAHHQPTTQIAKFLGVSVPTVAKAMIENGIWSPMEAPILRTVSSENPGAVTYTQIRSYTAHVSQWTDEELEYEIQLLRQHFPNSGVTMLHGHFRQRGENVPRERIRQALHRIAPGNHPFRHSCLRRQQYQVPGPNYLWHHDGQHGKYFAVIAGI